ITPVSPTAPSYLAKKLNKIGVPFVVGPLNGGVPWPREFNAERHAEKEYLSYLRGAYRMLPWRRATLNHADAIIAGSYHTASEVPKKHRNKVIWLPENAIDPAQFSAPPERADAVPGAGPLRACFIGRMVPYKGPDMLIEAAMPLLQEGIMSLDMIGDGPLLPELQAQVARGDVAHAVRFHGWVEHENVAEIAGQNTLLAFPSIREFGGGVVLEAMAMGLAPLIVDYAGPAELVQDDTGYKLPLGTREEIVAGLRGALRRLAAHPAEVMATGCRARAVVLEHFTWAAKAAKIAKIYDWVLDKELPRPDFSLVPPDAAHPDAARPEAGQQDAPQPNKNHAAS
ncbi:MAG: glycosyltransferase family 4 protein, partial [Rhodobacteraceae bacterium]|nr:glycosyltransferase family 4 protein [Paracoccaceae bacterium]